MKESITPDKALEWIELFVMTQMSLTSYLEPSARVLGRMEAHRALYDAIQTIKKRAKIKETDDIHAYKSHCRALSEC